MKLPWKVNSRKRGAGILTVLTASTLLLLLGLTVAGTAFHHLSVSNRLHHSQSARNLAEACLAKAVAQLIKQPTAYQSGPYATFIPPPLTSDQQVYVTFDPAQVAGSNANLKSTRLVRSYNNLSGTGQVSVDPNIIIPAESLYVRAVGVDHGVERAMECVLWVPPFPYAMAAGDKIELKGNSKVASLKNPADFSDPTKWVPGSLASNSNASPDAVQLKDTVHVTGDAQAVGITTVAATAKVDGETRSNYSRVRIPTLRVEDYDTHLKTGVQTYSSSTPPSSNVNGFAYRSGPLNFSSGINLNNGVVYVDGDLTVTGPISGQGALIATGKIDISGSGSLTSNNKVALLSKGDMTLTGTSSGRIGAQGLLYTDGKLKADYADIVGGVAAPTDATGQIDFTNVNVMSQSTSANVTVTVGGPPTPPTLSDLSISDSLASNMITIRGVSMSGTAGGVGLRLNVTNPNRFKDPATGEFHMPVVMDNARSITGAVLPAGQPYETVPGGPSGSYQIPAVTTVAPVAPSEVNVTVNGTDYLMTDNATWEPLARQSWSNYFNGILTPDLDASEEGSLDTLFSFFWTGTKGVSTSLPMMARYQFVTTQTIYQYNQALSTSSGPGETVTFSLNPLAGNFVNLAQDIRILYWREVPAQ